MSSRCLASRRFFSRQTSQPPNRAQQYKIYVPTYATIGLCILGYAYNLFADSQVEKKKNFRHRDFIDKNLIFSQRNYDAGRWWTTVTYSFMHSWTLHFGMNMVVLSSFGPLSVALFGLPATAALWLGGSVSANKLSMIGEDYKKKQRNSAVPHETIDIAGSALPRSTPEVVENLKYYGASGSLSSILAALACRIPQQGVMFFPIPMMIPMYGAVGGLAFMSAVAYAWDLVPFVSHTGHLGGMAFGVFYYVIALKNKRFPTR
ncbi:MAG: hypothetical protein Q9223_004903 [Gallowayella weberi]